MTTTVTEKDLANATGVQAYLEDTPFAADAIDALSGGTANFVYRIKLKTPFDGRSTMIVKHGKSYVATSKIKFPFSLKRQRFEVEALKHVHALTPSDSLVTAPRVNHFDEKENVIIMDDCGADSITLKQFMLDGRCTPALAEKIGDALGKFLGGMHHTWGTKGVAQLLETLKGHEEGKQISAWAVYGRVESTVTGEDPGSFMSDNPPDVGADDLERLKIIANETSAAVVAAETDFAMGDFWTGNILLDLAEGDSDVNRIFVVDWELAKPGLHGLDFGQFCAEVDLVRRFHPSNSSASSSVIASFYRAYSSLDETKNLALYRTAIVHWGAHLVVWTPRTAWGTPEETRKVVKDGIGVMLKGKDYSRDELDRIFQ
ncbi:hypothetical protein V5O48_006734 [Marasmius crinis-equi]|uniref:Aminoglycoside phosphotransferase domain-containing protein n=1 Tax=Marasmius crinis-equi TaxID=585013 RepID=A0ABR3FIS9_9AGAR